MPKGPNQHRAEWLPEQDQLLTEMWMSGKPVDDIADRLNRTPEGIRQRRFKLGLKARAEQNRTLRWGGNPKHCQKCSILLEDMPACQIEGCEHYTAPVAYERTLGGVV